MNCVIVDCVWCGKGRKAEWWGKPHVGPESAMCTPCRDRLCRKDEKGFVAITIAEHQKEISKEASK